MSYPQYDDGGEKRSNGWKLLGLTSITARVVTLVSLIVSIVVLKANHVTINGYVFTYKDVRSFKYVFFVTIIGFGYTLLQLPFAIYYMKTKKHLINSYKALLFDFYADKVLAFVLATGVGAIFGVTIDMKKIWGYSSDDEITKIQDFFTMAYISAAFLLLAAMASWISSLHSSFALTHNS